MTGVGASALPDSPASVDGGIVPSLAGAVAYNADDMARLESQALHSVCGASDSIDALHYPDCACLSSLLPFLRGRVSAEELDTYTNATACAVVGNCTFDSSLLPVCWSVRSLIIDSACSTTILTDASLFESLHSSRMRMCTASGQEHPAEKEGPARIPFYSRDGRLSSLCIPRALYVLSLCDLLSVSDLVGQQHSLKFSLSPKPKTADGSVVQLRADSKLFKLDVPVPPSGPGSGRDENGNAVHGRASAVTAMSAACACVFWLHSTFVVWEGWAYWESGCPARCACVH